MTIYSHSHNGYTPQEVADILGYKVSSIYAAISRNEISSNKVGNRRVITVMQLNEFIMRGKDRDQVIDLTYDNSAVIR